MPPNDASCIICKFQIDFEIHYSIPSAIEWCSVSKSKQGGYCQNCHFCFCALLLILGWSSFIFSYWYLKGGFNVPKNVIFEYCM